MKISIIIFVILLLLMNIVTCIKADEPSGYEMVYSDVIKWTSDYADMSIHPHTASEGIIQTQYLNFTWKKPNNNVDVDFMFPIKLEGEKDVFIWQNYTHIKQVPYHVNISTNYTLYNIRSYIVLPIIPDSLDYGDKTSTYFYYVRVQNGTRYINYSIGFDSFQWLFSNHTRAIFFYSAEVIVGYTPINISYYDWRSLKSYFHYTYFMNRHVYYCTDMSVTYNKTYLLKWVYCLPPNCHGKWELFIKLSSDTLQYALEHKRYASIDPWYNTSWQYSKKIIIDHTKIKCTMYNYPVLFANTTINFSHAQSDGDDFMFVAVGNTTKYNHEIESFVGNTLTAWVNITTLSSLTDTVLYLYYGNPSCESQQNVLGTWDTNRYVSVYHCNDLTTSSIKDSRNAKNGTKHGVNHPLQVTGKVSYAQNFTALSHLDDITISNTSLPSRNVALKPITITAWLKTPNVASTMVPFVTTHTLGGTGRATQLLFLSSALYCSFRDSGGGGKNSITSVSSNTWYFISAVRQADYKVVCYKNGGWFTVNNATGANANYSAHLKEYIGSSFTVSDWFNGILDELRLERMNTNLSQHQTQYNNMNSPSTFCSVGNEINNHAFELLNPFPQDGSVNQIPRVWLSVYAHDNIHSMNVSFQTNLSGSWRVLGVNYSVSTGTYRQYVVNLTMPNKKVYWRVNLTDGYGYYINNTYSFTTGLCNLSFIDYYNLKYVQGSLIKYYLPASGFTTYSNWTGNYSTSVLELQSFKKNVSLFKTSSTKFINVSGLNFTAPSERFNSSRFIKWSGTFNSSINANNMNFSICVDNITVSNTRCTVFIADKTFCFPFVDPGTTSTHLYQFRVKVTGGTLYIKNSTVVMWSTYDNETTLPCNFSHVNTPKTTSSIVWTNISGTEQNITLGYPSKVFLMQMISASVNSASKTLTMGVKIDNVIIDYSVYSFETVNYHLFTKCYTSPILSSGKHKIVSCWKTDTGSTVTSNDTHLSSISFIDLNNNTFAIDENVGLSATTSSVALTNLGDVHTNIYLTHPGYIFASLSMISKVNHNNKKIYVRIFINGIDTCDVNVNHISSTKWGTIALVTRTNNKLSPGVYEVRAKWCVDSGTTATAQNVTLFSFPSIVGECPTCNFTGNVTTSDLEDYFTISTVFGIIFSGTFLILIRNKYKKGSEKHDRL